MEGKIVRVRFAPSPTGPLHIGGLRTALYNYLFAKKHKGTFVLRIEDTDQARVKAGAVEHILDSLEWCGLLPDEGPNREGPNGPYKQSERKTTYKKYAKKLLDSGDAYIAFDTPEELDKKRKVFEQKSKEPFQYDNKTRETMRNALSLSKQEIKNLIENKTPYVVRIKTPSNTEIKFNDIIRGKIKINTNTMDDKVLLKADGMPTYHLANVVDDYRMKISHVIRGEEWLPSTPLHVFLYEKLGWKKQMPKFAHLPLILKPQGKGKLSKRDGEKMGYSVFPIQWEEEGNSILGFKEEGFLPQATLNILALLGWNPGTEKEVFSLKELKQEFSLNNISKAGARLDIAKSKWLNQKHLQTEAETTLINLIEEKAKEEQVFIQNVAEKALPLVKHRAETLVDLWAEARCFYCPPKKYNTKKWKKNTKDYTSALISAISKISDFSASNIKQTLKNLIEKERLSYSEVLVPLRILLLGDSIGPDLFKTIGVLGKKETIKRIKHGIKAIEK